jgi:hypothetical protein
MNSAAEAILRQHRREEKNKGAGFNPAPFLKEGDCDQNQLI